MPGLNASMIEPGPVARIPLWTSTEMSLMPGGMRNGVSGVSLSAIFMKSRKIGAV